MLKNRISNRDIMLDDLDSLFYDGEKASCMYSDPPWGQGNLKYWRTMNQQSGHEVNWIDFLNRLKFLYQKHVEGPLFLETGKRFVNDLINVFGQPDVQYTCVYGAKRTENILMCFGATPSIDLAYKSGVDLVYSCLASYAESFPASVFDPCVGLGNTAKACKKIGSTLYANELNEKRMLKTTKIIPFEVIGE